MDRNVTSFADLQVTKLPKAKPANSPTHWGCVRKEQEGESMPGWMHRTANTGEPAALLCYNRGLGSTPSVQKPDLHLPHRWNEPTLDLQRFAGLCFKGNRFSNLSPCQAFAMPSELTHRNLVTSAKCTADLQVSIDHRM